MAAAQRGGLAKRPENAARQPLCMEAFICKLDASLLPHPWTMLEAVSPQ